MKLPSPSGSLSVAAVAVLTILLLGPVGFVSGERGSERLQEWHDRMLALFEISGVVFTDLDEQQGRLTVGVQNRGLATAVEHRLRSLGVPLEAVDIVETEPIVHLATLRDEVRPLAGGLQINFASWLCTAGFNAIRSGVAGFVTNSHCTKKQGGVESTMYYQPLSPDFIGTEIADPTYTKGKCGSGIKGKVCRYSDSAYAQNQAGVSAEQGSIARIDSVNTGSLSIAGTFRIVSEGSSTKGDTVNKVGRTTGRTQGTVTNTCANVGVLGTNIVQICQDMVSAGVGGRDSGSPVFAITSGTDVQLRGILWGGNQAGTLFVYSPIANIERADELGPLTTCALGFTC